ncbi:hypothetical protein ACP70R_009179 [Stipagrostis hirtigluma subsp. patula]
MKSSALSATLLLFLVLALAAIDGDHPAVAAAAAQRRIAVKNFKGYDGDEVALAVHTDDLTIAGFTNRSRHWHAFPGHEHHLPGSTRLPFGSSYGDLIGGLANLPDLPLGRASGLRAVAALAAYNPVTATADEVEAVKRGLAALAVMTTESVRLRPVKETVEKGWNSEAYVAAEHLPYIEHWDTICFELIRANRTGEWDGPFTELLRETTNISSKEEALAVVDLISYRSIGDLLTAHARRA